MWIPTGNKDPTGNKLTGNKVPTGNKKALINMAYIYKARVWKILYNIAFINYSKRLYPNKYITYKSSKIKWLKHHEA